MDVVTWAGRCGEERRREGTRGQLGGEFGLHLGTLEGTVAPVPFLGTQSSLPARIKPFPGTLPTSKGIWSQEDAICFE